MRKVVVLHPPINYVVVMQGQPQRQAAWFIDEEDATDFVTVMAAGEKYEIAEVRR